MKHSNEMERMSKSKKKENLIKRTRRRSMGALSSFFASSTRNLNKEENALSKPLFPIVKESVEKNTQGPTSIVSTETSSLVQKHIKQERRRIIQSAGATSFAAAKRKSRRLSGNFTAVIQASVGTVMHEDTSKGDMKRRMRKSRIKSGHKGNALSWLECPKYRPMPEPHYGDGETLKLYLRRLDRQKKEDKEYIDWWFEWSDKVYENWVKDLYKKEDGEETLQFLRETGFEC